jgi:hypothetical protein
MNNMLLPFLRFRVFSLVGVCTLELLDDTRDKTVCYPRTLLIGRGRHCPNLREK